MLTQKKIKIGKKNIFAVCMKLQSKKLIVLSGSRGYVMCGYLNLKVAQKFGDAAVKIVGVSSISDALHAHAHSLTRTAKNLGLYKGQPINEVLRIIA